MNALIKNYKNRRKNATSRGMAFTIKPVTLFNMLNAKRCRYLNTPLNVKSRHFRGLTKVTIDRIDSNKGYVPGNVCASSNIANQLKNMVESGLITPEDIINFGQKLSKL